MAVELDGARSAFEAYIAQQGRRGRDDAEVFEDLLSELLHLSALNEDCKEWGRDPEELTEKAVKNYLIETGAMAG